MTYQLRIIGCVAALMAVGCGDDEDEATPVPTPDAQATSDSTGAADTAVTDTAVMPDVGDDDVALLSDTASSDTGADAVPEEVTSSDIEALPDADPGADPDAGPDGNMEDAAPSEDVASGEDISTGDASPGDAASPSVTFAEVYSEVFAANSCSSGYCHGAGAGGFTISDETGTHFALVNQSAMAPSCGLTDLVVPGDPESSLLWRRIRPVALDEGDVCAPKMPQGSEGVDAEDSQLVYDWIAGGALP